MEGPTPVSALIHAATMVTAGVFLIIRCSPLFEFAPLVLTIITFFGSLTAFFAATVGLFQNDIKKVIAYSTCSQLGYMVFACGLSNYSASFFHLANHAFFKALLFLSAGSVIHSMSNEQDMRKMGGLSKILPFTYSMMLIGSLSLMGFPFLTGFYSKDLILELSASAYTFPGVFSYWLGTLAALMTAFYSFRLIYLAFGATPNGYRQAFSGSHELPIFMAIPLGVLCFGSVFLGYVAKDMVVGLGTPFFGNSIVVSFDNMNMMEAEFIPHTEKVLPVLLSCFGMVSAVYINSAVYEKWDYHYLYWLADGFVENGPKIPRKPLFTDTLKLSNSFLWEKEVYKEHVVKHTPSNYLWENRLYQKIYSFFNNKWYFDTVYNAYIALPSLKLGYDLTFKLLDKGLIEFLGPWGLPKFVYDI